MGTLGYLERTWTWRRSVLVLGLTATPPTLMWIVDADASSWSAAATVNQVAIGILVLLAAVALYVQYRLDGDGIIAWLSLGTALLGVQSLSLATIRVSGPDGLLDQRGLVETADLGLIVLLLLLGRVRRQGLWRLDPLALGLLAGLTLTVAHLRLVAQEPGLDLSGPGMLAVHAAAAAVGVAVTRGVARSRGLSSATTSRLVAAVLLFAVNRAAGCQPTDTLVGGVITMATGIAASVLLLDVTLGGLRQTIRRHLRRLDQVREQLAEAEAQLRDQRERLHEITNSIAGIASASSLIRQRVDLAPPHRVRLERMLEREAARLARLLVRRQDDRLVPRAGPAATPAAISAVVDLDDTLEPLVVAQEAVGHPVDWAPSGLRAVGDPDGVAEAVNILLDNARKHAPSAPAHLSVQAVDDRIEIRVSDDGPGIAPDVRHELFEWGRHGEESTGQGIGLHLARRLLDDVGASLELAPTTVGTTFVITLPSPERIAS